jgi:nucleotide-binding universal stress UspA family protein
MKKIIAPCDFSEPAIQAFKFAVAIAKKSHGQIVLLHAIELPVLHDTTLMPTLSFEEAFFTDLRKNAESNFKKMKDKWAAGVKTTAVIEYGSPAAAIHKVISDHEADLVVMGTKGASGAQEFFIGSNAEKVIRLSPVPVITLKDEPGTIKKIALAVQPGSDTDEKFMTAAKQLQDHFQAELHLVFINTPMAFQADSVTHNQLQALVKRFMLANYQLHIYNDIEVEAGLANFAQQLPADMIAMGTHGRRGLRHLVMGSIAEDVANHARCPIWTYRL